MRRTNASKIIPHKFEHFRLKFSFFACSEENVAFIAINRSKMNLSKHILKVGYIIEPGYAEPCAYTGAFASCERPGITAELWRVIGEYVGAEIQMYSFKGYGIGAPSENATIFKALTKGEVDVTGPDSAYCIP